MSHATAARRAIVQPIDRRRAGSGASAGAETRALLLRGLRSWLGLGLLALALVPASRGFNPWIGWLPFWLVLAPLSMLAVVEHVRLADAFDALLATGRRRRLRARRPQARPIGNLQRHGQRRARAA
jgi:hypothetical protein